MIVFMIRSWKRSGIFVINGACVKPGHKPALMWNKVVENGVRVTTTTFAFCFTGLLLQVRLDLPMQNLKHLIYTLGCTSYYAVSSIKILQIDINLVTRPNYVYIFT